MNKAICSAVWRVAKEPLLQFFVVAIVLYGVYAWVTPPLLNQHVIKVDNGVVNHLQATSNMVRPANSNRDLRDLKQDYIRDEALYREALAMGLDKDDFVIKRRLIQKLTFLISDLNTINLEPTEEQLQQYYQAHQQKYRAPATMSFTHVFLNQDNHRESIGDDSKRLLLKLNVQKMSSQSAKQFGDRFPMKRVYGDATPNAVAAHFGRAFADKLFRLNTSTQWQGPITSGFGQHVVLVMNKSPAKIEPFAKVMKQVRDNWVYDELKRRNRLLMNNIVQQYKVIDTNENSSD